MKKLLLFAATSFASFSFSQSVTRLLVVSNFDNTLRVLDTATYAQLSSKTMTFSAGSFQGIHGLARKPSTGVFYGVVNDGAGTRYLASINPVTGSVTNIGSLGDNFSQLTFNANSTLLGVTGSGGSNPSRVYRINTTNAAKSSIAQINNVYGQVIAYNPVDNRVYHWTGGNNVTFNSYDTSFISSTNISIGASSSEVTSAVYKTGGVFTTSDWDLNYRKVRAAGGSTVYTYYGSAGYYPKGMAYITCSRSITPTTPTVCANNTLTPITLTMSGVAGATYQWYKNNVAISGATLITLNTSTTGLGYYKCRILDGCGQDSLAAGVTVSVAPLPTVSISGSTFACSGTSLQLSGSNGGTSQWYRNGVLLSGATTNTYLVTSSGLYNMIKTNLNGCADSSAVGKTVTIGVTPTVAVNSDSICSGSNFTILPTGASTYTISGGTAIVSPLTNTVYNVTGTSAQGCVSSNTAVSSVTVNASPTIAVNSGTICSTKSFTILPTGANTYTISGGSAIVSPLTNTVYSITGTSSFGCIGTNTAVSSVTVNVSPTISVSNYTICSGNTLTVTPTGASTYTYSNGSNVYAPITNTTISISGTSSLGCVSTNTAISSITVNASPTIAVNSGSICSGNSFVIVPSGASVYTVSGGTSTVSPINTSSYTIIGISAQGCVGSNTAVCNVTINITPTVSANSGSICLGQTFTIVPAGGNSYTVQGGSTVISPTANVSLNIVCSTSLGCVSTNTAVCSVTVNPLPIITVNSGTICAGNAFTITPSGAVTYTISGGASVVSPATTSNYSVTGTSSFGCDGSVAINTVVVNSLPSVNASSSNSAICAGESAILSAGGASTYVWSTLASTSSISISPTTTTAYTVTGTDANGCANSFTISQVVSACTGIISSIDSKTTLQIYPNPNNGEFTIQSAFDITLTITNELGQVVKTVSLNSNKQQQVSISELANGIYFVTGQNNNQVINQKIIVNK